MTSGSVPTPSRKDRILQAALDLIVQEGVAGFSLRGVAQQATVSLGSVTYYFQDKDELLQSAFLTFSRRSVEEFSAYYEGVSSFTEARAATIRMLIDSASNRRDVVIGTELYTLSLHRPRHRVVADLWSRSCREVMARYFDPTTTFILDAFYEGMLLHRSMRLGEYSDERITIAVERMTPPESYIGP